MAKRNQSDDAAVAAAARQFVKALKDLDLHGGDHAATVATRREALEAAVAAESADETEG